MQIHNAYEDVMRWALSQTNGKVNIENNHFEKQFSSMYQSLGNVSNLYLEIPFTWLFHQMYIQWNNLKGILENTLHVRDIYNKSKINENKPNVQRQEKWIVLHHYIIKQLLNISVYAMLFHFTQIYQYMCQGRGNA